MKPRRAVLLGMLVLAGCAGPAGLTPSAGVKTLRIAGSDTMYPLVARWAEEYMRTHPGVAVYAEGGGTGAGIRALIDGKVDLCAASRTMHPEEIRELLERRGFLGVNVLTGKDALSIYLHPANPVHNLTLAQLRSILTGATTRWSEVGGEDRPISVHGRQPNSGTYGFVRDHVLDGAPYAPGAATHANTAAVVRAVVADPGAIGYGGMAYGDTVAHCALEGVTPTPGHVRDGFYPLARYLYLYSGGPLEGPAAAFTDWVLSGDGQRVVQDVGYISLWELPEADEPAAPGPVLAPRGQREGRGGDRRAPSSRSDGGSYFRSRLIWPQVRSSTGVPGSMSSLVSDSPK